MSLEIERDRPIAVVLPVENSGLSDSIEIDQGGQVLCYKLVSPSLEVGGNVCGKIAILGLGMEYKLTPWEYPDNVKNHKRYQEIVESSKKVGIQSFVIRFEDRELSSFPEGLRDDLTISEQSFLVFALWDSKNQGIIILIRRVYDSNLGPAKFGDLDAAIASHALYTSVLAFADRNYQKYTDQELEYYDLADISQPLYYINYSNYPGDLSGYPEQIFLWYQSFGSYGEPPLFFIYELTQTD